MKETNIISKPKDKNKKSYIPVSCVFVVPAPGVKDRSLRRVRACVRRRRRFSQLLQKRGKDRFKASKLHNFIPLFLLRLK